MPRGGRRPGAGRKKGSPNKVTAEGRAILLALVEKRMPDLDAMIEDTWHGIEIEKQMPDGTTVVGRLNADPAGAAKIVLAASEFCFPKIGRTEVTGANGGPLRAVFRIEDAA